MIQLVILKYAEIPREKLEKIANRVIPPMLQNKAGRSDSRMRSYFAGRSTIAWHFAQHQTPLFIAPNRDYGFLEVYDASARKKDLFVNLSHTEEVAVAVFGTSSVGVDIESRKRRALRVLPRVATETEKKWVADESHLKSHPDVPTDIFLWSAKEAFSKALGLGMKFGFQGFSVEKSNENSFSAKTEISGPLRIERPKILLETFEDYIITICTDEKHASAGINRRVLLLRDLETLG